MIYTKKWCLDPFQALLFLMVCPIQIVDGYFYVRTKGRSVFDTACGSGSIIRKGDIDILKKRTSVWGSDKDKERDTWNKQSER